jgi:glycolate oxidase
LHAAHAIVATGQQAITCDTTVPPTHIPALQQAITTIAQRHHLAIPTLGHAGDGNLHPVILFDGDDPAQRAMAAQAHEELTAAALDLGGTITGEHGVGSEKRHSMHQRFRPAEIAAMRAVKTAFDPAGLLNPGILLPPPSLEEPALPQFGAAAQQAVDARRHDGAWSAPIAPAPVATGAAGAITVDVENRTVTAAATTPLPTFHATLAAHGLRSSLPTTAALLGAVVTADPAARTSVRESLLGVRALVPEGVPVHFGSSLLKDVAGYDLKRLYIGSGSLFGLLHEVTVQVWRRTVA